MPKIIKNVEQKVSAAALELFGEKGYAKVEMKMIAQKANIAVGTLYNYYSNKEDLYINVFKKSWEITFKKLNTVINSSGSINEKLETFIKTLYEEVENRKGIGKIFNEANVFNSKINNPFIEIKNTISNKLNELIGKNIDIRYTSLVLLSITHMLNDHPQEKEKNMEFLFRLNDLLLNQ